MISAQKLRRQGFSTGGCGGESVTFESAPGAGSEGEGPSVAEGATISGIVLEELGAERDILGAVRLNVKCRAEWGRRKSLAAARLVETWPPKRSSIPFPWPARAPPFS